MKAINKKDAIIKRKRKKEETAIIMTDNGICSLKTNVDVMGIQLQFKGTAEITPELPDGWILQGNRNTIIMFTLQSLPIQNQTLFSYKGVVDITSSIISNDKGERLSDRLLINNPDWRLQGFTWRISKSNFEDLKDTKRVGKVNRTTYNLPDYNLPKVEKKKIKRTQASSRSTGGY